MAEYGKGTEDNNSISKLLIIDSKLAKEEGKEDQSLLELLAKEGKRNSSESAGA